LKVFFAPKEALGGTRKPFSATNTIYLIAPKTFSPATKTVTSLEKGFSVAEKGFCVAEKAFSVTMTVLSEAEQTVWESM